MLIVDVDDDACGAAARELRTAGGEAAFLHADVMVERDAARFVRHALEEFGGLDVLVNNAGGYEQPVFPDTSVAHWSRTLDLNLRSVLLGIQAALPVMESRGGGAVVNVASSAGLGLAAHTGPEYAAAKAAVVRLTASLAWRGERGVRVNCVCPHTVGTEGVRRTIAELQASGEPLPSPLRDELLEPTEVADAVAGLVAGDTLSGRVVVCRGGEPPRLLPLD